MRLTIKHVRRATERLKKVAIPPEECGCIKYDDRITLTCGIHTIPMTQEQIVQALKNLHALGIDAKAPKK